MPTALRQRVAARGDLVPPVELGELLAILAILSIGCNEAKIEDGIGSVGGVSGNGGAGGRAIAIPLGTGGTSGGGCKILGGSGCLTQIPEGCGDGINNQNGIEECDDGNALPGDGCNGNCKVERNWSCPKQGPCTRNVVCGDGAVGPGEVCDDGNTIDGDGCNGTCTVQDPAYTCRPGQPCVRASICGNARIEPGEECDDGNGSKGDGCSDGCHLEAGWVCPSPGSACTPSPRCGDGVVQASIGEVCDDGNQQDGDGCSADCKSKGVSCTCTPGKLCQCAAMACGNGILEGSEKCDDGDTTGGDGCSKDCRAVEPGYQCRVMGKACTPRCGDGLTSGIEQCDDGNTASGDGCSATCRLELGYKCTGSPSKCNSTTCGDGTKEGAEGCDDGNNLSFDGCSMDCQPEPDCNGRACISTCGDGIVMNEDCDDGNAASGDGCSKDCKVEPGWTCAQPRLGDKMLVPAVYRDFKFHSPSDFEPGVQGSEKASPGVVKAELDADAKPEYTGITGGSIHIESPATFRMWYRNVDGINHATSGRLALWNNGKDAYVNRYKDDGTQWYNTEPAYYCGNVGSEKVDATGNPIPCTSKQASATNCDELIAKGEEMLPGSCIVKDGSYSARFIISKMDGNPLFFPVDKDTFSAATDLGIAQVPPYYEKQGTWPKDVDGNGVEIRHNFSFTSEVRYWFKFDKSKSYTLDFVGDDDVWVFINRKLAVDLGGIHTPVAGSVTIDAATAGSFDIADGNIYEAAVFHAERQTTSSSYKLTLSGFNGAASDCVPTCGDGIVVGGEECDCGNGKVPVPANCTGANDSPAYNGCTAQCKWGPYCGDGQLNGDEACDNGTNNDDYGITNGCAPGCRLPARCGDGIIQADFDEECDDGGKNASISDPMTVYGGCTAGCKRGGRCGDGIANGPEQCDDGVNDGSYETCNPDCSQGPRCGDGIIQSAYGEECEPKMSGDRECTPSCRKPGGCGDGMIEEPEQCDDGALFNKGEYGGCAPSCIFAPHCGDGIVNGPEQCDDGVLDNSYGGCTKQCKLGPHCGDGVLDSQEECDNGADNGVDGRCTKECKKIIFLDG